MLNDRTLNDVKAKLPDYSYFGYSNISLYDNDIITISNDVMRIYFYKKITKDIYEEIQEKELSSYTENELNLYWAEVYAICYEFLKFKNISNNTKKKSVLRVEGYQFQINSGSDEINIDFFEDKMSEYFYLAGINIYSLQRTCNIFGSDEYYG